ncbi:Transcriptional regulator, LysR family [Alloalcanivorax xenomutans]|uniref:LysR family transcriptional regulator n=1 Tax=Alloalcanivorax xenomutans TaxID=1094342 RepID=UPI0006D5BFD9|nr:LysR family transcriptional regulator [Alloalcanivorax xenomutans]CUR47824.1 Transcriptional regulator, LysR family [Alloalcanivorax xenomutans]
MKDWDDFRFLLALSRSGTLREAARRLGVNETTMARRLAAVEARQGTTLFLRGRDGLQPTPTGERLARAAERMEQALLRTSPDHGQGTVSGLVRLTSVAWIVEALLAPRLIDLHRRHPALTMELAASNTTVSLSRRDADLALRLARPREEHLVARRLGALGLTLASSVRGSAQGWIAYHRGWDDLPEIQAMAGVFRDPPVARIAGLTGIQAAVRSGLGMAMLPDPMIDADPGLVAAQPTIRVSRPLWVVLHEDLRERPAIRACLDWLEEVVRDAGWADQSSLKSK